MASSAWLYNGAVGSPTAGGWTRTATVVGLTTGSDTIDAVPFATGHGLSFAGVAAPITMVGGDDGFGDTAIIVDNATDDYNVVVFNQPTDLEMDGYTSSVFIGNANLALSADTQIAITTPNLLIAGATTTENTRSTALGASDFITPTWVRSFLTPTTGSATGLYNGLTLTYKVGATVLGADGIAAIGTAVGLNNGLFVTGSGDAANDNVAYGGFVTMQIGTGYTQTAGPTGHIGVSDFGIEGPIGLQPTTFTGVNIVGNNHYNGNPASDRSSLFAAVTRQGNSSGSDPINSVANTYSIQSAFMAVGTSTSSANSIGFDVAFQAGGTGAYAVAGSAIGTGLDVRDYWTAGINIHAAGAVTAPSIIFDTFLQSAEMASAPAAPAANGVRIYAVDNGGKTELLAIFASGAAQRLAIQP